MKHATHNRDADLQAEHDFLLRWRRTSSRDTAGMLRASLLRRTNPDLVKKVEMEKEPVLTSVD
ncbi:hypothetical protein [Acetobacter conturbans]|uniref:Uncharacterized protein n=1 Tax=Acetobacter conturbans TaxID=1737472 RepID=A0ABX0JYW6_9PROT|nr:hypothetical protein [Acetobacter conturbans]NHN88666.1 hypothetical protein [Acetobacter conturbans]